MIGLARNIQELFRNFYLGGGTALMFRHAHRISTDLDFFKKTSFSFLKIASKMRNYFSIQKEEKFSDNIDFIVEGIKVSFIFFPFENIKPLEDFGGIKMASDYDIFLNKIYPSGRRVETKDVIDFAFLYEKYRWDRDMVKRDFEKKFPNQSFYLYLYAIMSVEDYPD